MDGKWTKIVPPRYAESPSIEPTERSTLRVMMTMASPTAITTRIDGVISRSCQPSLLNRKSGFLIVLTTTTRAKASRMPISRERSTLSSRLAMEFMRPPQRRA